MRPDAPLPVSTPAAATLSEPAPAPLTRSIFVKTAGDTCCAGVDVPGVGHVHNHDCEVAQIRAYLQNNPPRDDARAVSAQLKRLVDGAEVEERRAKLMAQLLFASRDLAEKQIVRLVGAGGGVSYCRECWRSGAGDEFHAPTCSAGRVLGLLEELQALADDAAGATSPASVPDATGHSAAEERAYWTIQRRVHRSLGAEIVYRDFEVPEGRMATRAQALDVLERVQRRDPDHNFRLLWHGGAR